MSGKKKKRVRLRVDVELSEVEVELLLDALESHAYWQISDEHYRNNGFVHAPGSDDPTGRQVLAQIDLLSEKLGGEPVTSERICGICLKNESKCSCVENGRR